MRSFVLGSLLIAGLAGRAGVARADEPATDHARVVGSVGIGWFGVSEIPLGQLDQSVVAPALGVRWWLTERVGLDLGLGLSIVSQVGSATVDGTVTIDDDGPFTLGVLGHVGVPIALYQGRHYTLLVVPELNVGVASLSSTNDRADDSQLPLETEQTGLRVDAGGRAGAEIHFGFIGLPELALEASVGLFFSHEATSLSSGGSSREATRTQLVTTSFNDPWDFFRSAVAARYYF